MAKVEKAYFPQNSSKLIKIFFGNFFLVKVESDQLDIYDGMHFKSIKYKIFEILPNSHKVSRCRLGTVKKGDWIFWVQANKK